MREWQGNKRDAKKKGMKWNKKREEIISKEIQQLIRIAFMNCPCTKLNKLLFFPDS